MKPREYAFLKAVVGVDGAKALAKAVTAAPDLEWAVFPRALLAWLEAVEGFGYDAPVPGVTSACLTLAKTEAGHSGRVSFDDQVYAFEAASLYHVAGSVAVALGLDGDAPSLRHPALAKLGKSIDVLVKARTLRKIQQKVHGGAKGAQGPGQAAAPQPPEEPVAPTPTQPKQADEASGTRAATGPIKPKLPGLSPSQPRIKRPTVKVTKAEAARPCPGCGDHFFEENRYIACVCFEGLGKSVKTSVVASGNAFVLEFGPAWDEDAILTLASNLGK